MRAKRVDANQAELIAAARAMGILIVIIWEPTDFIAGHRNQWVFVECKFGKGRYTRRQLDFMADCQYFGLPVLTWRSEDDILEFVNRPYDR